MKGLFVTGTGTGAGKTVVTGLLARYLRERGRSVITQKWVQTGSRASSEDIKAHLWIMGAQPADVQKIAPHMNPYSFRFPSSPHLAARLERKKIDIAKIKKSFRRLCRCFEHVIVEGTGGPLVPLDEKTLLIDVAKGLRMDVLIVAANSLGAINHALLTVEAVRKRRMKLVGIVFDNCQKNVSKAILKDNPVIVEKISGVKVFGTLPRAGDIRRLYADFEPMAKRIVDTWTAGLKRT